MKLYLDHKVIGYFPGAGKAPGKYPIILSKSAHLSIRVMILKNYYPIVNFRILPSRVILGIMGKYN